MPRPPRWRHSSSVLFLVPTVLAGQQARATVVKPARCAATDSLWSQASVSRTEVQAVYLADRQISLIFSTPPRSISPEPGVVATTGLVRVPEREMVSEPQLEITVRAITDPLGPSSRPLGLVADDIPVLDVVPVAVRVQGMVGGGRALASVTVMLSAAQTIQLARASRLGGAFDAVPFTLTDRERDEVRVLVQVGLCGAQKAW